MLYGKKATHITREKASLKESVNQAKPSRSGEPLRSKALFLKDLIFNLWCSLLTNKARIQSSLISDLFCSVSNSYDTPDYLLWSKNRFYKFYY